MVQDIGWSNCVSYGVKARISQLPNGCGSDANVSPRWRKVFRRGKRGCGGHGKDVDHVGGR